MGKLKNKEGKQESFVMIPTRLIKSKDLDAYDKIVFCIISSFQPSFPSYEKIQSLAGISRERVWKSLRKLSEMNLISRFKRGRSIEYVTWWENQNRSSLPDEKVMFRKITSSPDELIKPRPVRQTNSTSSPDELVPVRQTNSNYITPLESLIREDLGDETTQDPENIKRIAQMLFGLKSME